MTTSVQLKLFGDPHPCSDTSSSDSDGLSAQLLEFAGFFFEVHSSEWTAMKILRDVVEVIAELRPWTSQELYDRWLAGIGVHYVSTWDFTHRIRVRSNKESSVIGVVDCGHLIEIDVPHPDLWADPRTCPISIPTESMVRKSDLRVNSSPDQDNQLCW
jgi:hypothetical protein